jgi:GNAT superfamily N-acetyltransferase
MDCDGAGLMPRLTIRQAVPEELPWIRKLFSDFVASQYATHRQAYPAFNDDELDAFTIQCLRQMQHHPFFRVYLAWHGKKAVGLLGGELMTRLVGLPRAYLAVHWLWVDPSYRHVGVTRRLQEPAFQWAEANGVTTVEWRALGSDHQWSARGYATIARMYAAPIADVRAQAVTHTRPVAEAALPNGHAHPPSDEPMVEETL